MIYNIWGFFAFYFQVLQKVEEGGKGARGRESKHKEETPGTFSQVEIIPLELFLTLFFMFFFPLLDVKITKKILSRKQKPQYIYYIHLAAAPVYLQKCCLLSTCTNYFNTWSFFKLRLLYRKFLEDKSRLQEGTELFNIFTFFKELTYFQPKRKRLVFIFIYIYLYM